MLWILIKYESFFSLLKFDEIWSDTLYIGNEKYATFADVTNFEGMRMNDSDTGTDLCVNSGLFSD